MKKRLTKKARHIIARRKVKKLQRLKTNKELIINLPREIIYHKKKAALTYLLVGMAFFIFFDHSRENRQLARFYENEISFKIAKAVTIQPDLVAVRTVPEKLIKIKSAELIRTTAENKKTAQNAAALKVTLAMAAAPADKPVVKPAEKIDKNSIKFINLTVKNDVEQKNTSDIKTADADALVAELIKPVSSLEKFINDVNDNILNFKSADKNEPANAVEDPDLKYKEALAQELKSKILPIIKNTPMEAMTGEICTREKPVAAFLVGIAMKESKFGIYSPKKDGQDCFNYWGYRGKENPTKSGYSCFDSPEQAVKIVGDRIETFVERGLASPADMIIWKCGYSCDGHEPESVRKWIADVSIHYNRINSAKEIVKN